MSNDIALLEEVKEKSKKQKGLEESIALPENIVDVEDLLTEEIEQNLEPTELLITKKVKGSKKSKMDDLDEIIQQAERTPDDAF